MAAARLSPLLLGGSAAVWTPCVDAVRYPVEDIIVGPGENAFFVSRKKVWTGTMEARLKMSGGVC